MKIIPQQQPSLLPALVLAAVLILGNALPTAFAQGTTRKLNALELVEQLERGPIAAYWRTPSTTVPDKPAPELWFVECEPLAKFTPEGAAAIDAFKQVINAVPLIFDDVRAAPSCQALMAGNALHVQKMAPTRTLSRGETNPETATQALRTELTGSSLNRLVIADSLGAAAAVHPELARLAPGEVAFFRVSPTKTLDLVARSNTAELVSAANQAIVKRQAAEAAKPAKPAKSPAAAAANAKPTANQAGTATPRP
jgi:hypothetical protein